LLCLVLACPLAAKPPEEKGHTPPGQAKKSAKPKKAQHVPPGQAKKAATPTKAAKPKKAQHVPPGQAKKTAEVAPGQAMTSTAAPPKAKPKKHRARRGVTAQASGAGGSAPAAAARANPPDPATPPRAPGRTAAAASDAGTRASQEGKRRQEAARAVTAPEELPRPLRVVRDIVEVVPTGLRYLVAGLVALTIMLLVASGLTLLRNRRLAAQRRELLGEVGLLQAALLPVPPKGLRACRASVAYRPADGPGAGGDFYDVISLAGGRTAILIGDVSGHGRAALGRTALARYTLRAYIEAGLEPREALQIAGSVLAGKLEGDFVTALVAVHDAGAGTLTYASAGHPPPIVISSTPFDPVLAGTAPPLGVGAGTGQRQSTLPFPRGAVACFYTDGLSEARTADGRLGTASLERLVRELGPGVTAEQVIEQVAGSAGTIADDAAACVIAAQDGPGIVRSRVERLDLTRAELRGPRLSEFLDACGVGVRGVRAAEREARELARRTGSAIVEVRLGDRPEVDVRAADLVPGDVATAALRQPSAPGR
jgi:hypothetical protein